MKIDFERHHSTWGKYADALHLPDDHTFTDEQIEAMKDERFNNWIQAVENPPAPPEEPTPEPEPVKEYIEINGVKYIKAEI
jgi:hypothetical protein